MDAEEQATSKNGAADAPVRLPERAVVFHLCREIEPVIKYTLFGGVLKRITDFCDRFDTEANGKVLAKCVERDFVKETNEQEYMIIVVLQGGEIVGHLLVHLDIYYGYRSVYVHQAELNHARVSPDEVLNALKLVNDWGKMQGAKKIKGASITKRQAERMERNGFKQELILLGKDVE